MIKIEHHPNNAKVLIQIDKSKQGFKNGIRQGFWKLGKDLVKTAKQGILKPPKTGRVYKIGKHSHQASKAGEYPANQRPAIRKARKQSTANDARLAFSLGFNIVGWSIMYFGSKVPHGKFLQEGTRFIKPRPFLTLSVNSNERNAIKHFQNEIDSRL